MKVPKKIRRPAKRGPGRPKKSKPIQLELTLANGDLFTMAVSSRRELAGLMFEDTRGRKRLYVDGDPLLSNITGPAISYPDGEEDFFINGRQAEIFQVPGYVDYVDLHAGLLWEGVSKFPFAIGHCKAVFTEGESGSRDYWTITLNSEQVPYSHSQISFALELSDFDLESRVFHNPLALTPKDYFRTTEFGYLLLEAMSELLPTDGNYFFLTPQRQKTLVEFIVAQLKRRDDSMRADPQTIEQDTKDMTKVSSEAITAYNEKYHASITEAPQQEKVVSDSGFSKVMMAGLAAVGTASAMALLGSSAGKAAKHVATARA